MWKSLVTLAKIGIETELGVSDRSSARLSSSENVYEDYKGIKVCWDREYYDSQIEFKCFPTEPTVENIDRWKDFIRNRIAKSGAKMNDGHWVWTHIHLYLEKGGAPYSTKLERKILITRLIYKALFKFHMDRGITVETDVLDFQRLSISHNLFRYFDSQYCGDKLKGGMMISGTGYTQFSSGVDRPKYSPVIWSFPNEYGKPMTLEIRLFSNQFLLSTPSSEILALLESVILILNMGNKEAADATPEALEELMWLHMIMSRCGRLMGIPKRIDDMRKSIFP